MRSGMRTLKKRKECLIMLICKITQTIPPDDTWPGTSTGNLLNFLYFFFIQFQDL